MSNRINKVLKGMPASDGAGVNLTRALGQPALKYIDPFLMLDEIKSDDPNDYIAGFPPHPHRGFETLTYLMHGSMEHNDSTGGHGLINSGGVQYMTAGKGIIHSETPKQDQGLLWGFQLWINLPSTEKMVDASYVDIERTDIPTLNLNNQEDGKITSAQVKLIAGKFNNSDETGPVKRDDIDLQIYDLTNAEKSALPIKIDTDAQGYLYVYQGSVEAEGKTINETHIAEISTTSEQDESSIKLTMAENTGVLLAVAKPIGEPIVQYGPFVMNTAEEIETALRDYQSGRLA
ncbi:MAG: pirin family protein [Gammaproteobacteria bacterium]|nr:pirin family protein [Gammaproteobacteria bacterium]